MISNSPFDVCYKQAMNGVSVGTISSSLLLSWNYYKDTMPLLGNSKTAGAVAFIFSKTFFLSTVQCVSGVVDYYTQPLPNPIKNVVNIGTQIGLNALGKKFEDQALNQLTIQTNHGESTGYISFEKFSQQAGEKAKIIEESINKGVEDIFRENCHNNSPLEPLIGAFTLLCTLTLISYTIVKIVKAEKRKFLAQIKLAENNQTNNKINTILNQKKVSEPLPKVLSLTVDESQADRHDKILSDFYSPASMTRYQAQH